MIHDPIDAVITWVDGEDPVHVAKRAKYVNGDDTQGAESTRFASRNEITYCVLSILKHAPFFSKIYIVTDAQIPPIFEAVKRNFPEQLHKIKIIDHKEIFQGFEEYLPNYNSSTITSMFHKIPSLNAKFVFFNDDFVLVRNVNAADFFQGEKPVLRGEWMRLKHVMRIQLKKILYSIMGTPKSKRRLGGHPRQKETARLVGYNGPVFLASHTPYPMRKSVRNEFESTNPQLFKQNLAFRFRDPAQIQLESLVNHTEIKNNNAVIIAGSNPPSYEYIDARTASITRINRRLGRVEQNNTVKFLCIQSLDKADATNHKTIVEWLENWIGNAK